MRNGRLQNMLGQWLRTNQSKLTLGVSIISAALLVGCQSQESKFGSAPDSEPVAIIKGNSLAALDGNTLVLRRSGDRIYFSSKRDTLLRRIEGRNLLRRLIGREVTREGIFAASAPSIGPDKQIVGMAAASTDARMYATNLVLLQTYKGDDRIVDLAARPRVYLSLSVSGDKEHVSCLVTPWIDSRKRSKPSDFKSEPCKIVKGIALPNIEMKSL